MTLAIAHRGDPHGERENTLAAFDAAVRQGADMLELDLRRTRDDQIVVLHDPTLNRLWEVDTCVSEVDLAELQQIGTGDLRIPTLRKLLGHVDVPLMVDFTVEDVVESALHDVRQADAMERSLFVTWNVPALRRLRDLAPEAHIGLTWIKPDLPWTSLLQELAVEYWNPMLELVTPENVAHMHALGLKVSTWTVDNHRDMARVADADVDAIVSNRTADLRRFLSGLNAST